MAVRMADVAALAGVSITTVSHVLNKTRPVSPELQEKVHNAVLKSGYSPNFVARSLATRNTMLIGVVMSFLSNPFFGPLVSAIEEPARHRGYTLLLTDNRESAQQEMTQIKIMLDHQVDGVILAPVSADPTKVLNLLADQHIPTVLIDRFATSRFDDIGVENLEPTAQLVAHLVERGHTRIGMISGRTGLSTTVERVDGYQLGLQRAGLHYDRRLVRSGGSRIELAQAAVKMLMKEPKAPTAIVSGNNAMSVGVLRGLREIGVRVPEDVALVAFDDIAWADLMHPGLTAMAQPFSELGELAVKLLLKRMGGYTGPPERKTLPPSFRHRESCGCPPTTKDVVNVSPDPSNIAPSC